MSAADDYGKHRRTRPRAGAPTADVIAWVRKKIAILNRYAAEEPHMKDWARREINQEMQYLADLRTGKAK